MRSDDYRTLFNPWTASFGREWQPPVSVFHLSLYIFNRGETRNYENCYEKTTRLLNVFFMCVFFEFTLQFADNCYVFFYEREWMIREEVAAVEKCFVFVLKKIYNICVFDGILIIFQIFRVMYYENNRIYRFFFRAERHDLIDWYNRILFSLSLFINRWFQYSFHWKLFWNCLILNYI